MISMPILIQLLLGCNNKIEFPGLPARICDIQIDGHTVMSREEFHSNPIADIYEEVEVNGEGRYLYSRSSDDIYEGPHRIVSLTILDGTASIDQGNVKEVECDGDALGCYEIECKVKPRDQSLTLPIEE